MSGLDRDVLLFGPFRLEVANRTLLREGQAISLAPKEFETLLVLVENAGQLVSKEQLISQVWPDTFVGDGSLARNISVLRRAMGEDLIQTAPKLGYRFTAAVTVEQTNGHSAGNPLLELQAADTPMPRAEPAGVAAREATHWRSIALLTGVLLTVLAAAGLINRMMNSRQRKHAITAEAVKIAVLPFENLTGNDNEEYLCDGLTEAMISELSRLNAAKLQVIARTSAMQYKKTNKLISQIGRELGVDYLLESSVRSSADRVHITSQLVRASNATHVWTGEYDRDLKDVLQLQQQVAVAIAEEINLKLAPGTDSRVAHGHVVNPEAYRYYLLGRYHWNKRTRENIEQSLNDYERAEFDDPAYARPYAGMADTYLSIAWWGITPYREAYSKSQQAAQRAIQLDPSLAEPYATLGVVDFMYTLDWVSAEENFRKAIALDPNYATAHHWYAEYLAAMKRPDQAIAEIRRAAELDPLSLGISQNTGFVLIQAGRYQEAIQQLQKSLEIDPDNQVSWGYLGLAHENLRQYDQALEDFRKAQRLSGEFAPYAPDIAQILAIKGKQDQARRILLKLITYRTQHELSAYAFVYVYAALGEKDTAFQWLDQSIEERSITAAELNNDRRLDSLRTDARFDHIRRGLNLAN
jgi:TolB-like protein/DNA-binding winged helix-turn-helix (wHTH) protein/Flp pilus assembly protein TadD